MSNLKFKPFITFNDKLDTGVNGISLGSFVQILKDDDDEHRLIFVKKLDGMSVNSTVSDLLSGDATNFTNILKNYDIGGLAPNRLISDTTPTISSDIGGQFNIMNDGVYKGVSRTVQTLNLTGNVNINVSLGEVIVATLTGNTTITFSGLNAGSNKLLEVLLRLENPNGYTLTFTNTITWENGFVLNPFAKYTVISLLTGDAGYTYNGEILLGTDALAYNINDFSNTLIDSYNYLSTTSNGRGISFSPDGMYWYMLVDTTTTRFEQFTLSTPWEIGTTNHLYTLEVASPSGTEVTSSIDFSYDGSKMYMTTKSQKVYQYNLSTPWMISSAIYIGFLDVSAEVSTANASVNFDTTGTKMYVGSTTAVYQYTLSTPWDVRTGVYANKSMAIASGADATYITDDGTKYFVNTELASTIYQYTISTPWDISSGTLSASTLNISTMGFGDDFRMFISKDFSKLYTTNTTTDTIYQYNNIDV